MDENMEQVREELKKRFGAHAKVSCKYKPKFPMSAEREYFRLINRQYAEFKKALESNANDLKKAIKLKNMDDDKVVQKAIDLRPTKKKVDGIFANIEKALKTSMALTSTAEGMQDIANLTERLSINEWKKALKKTLGIDLMDDVYNGNLYKHLLKNWVRDNTDLITTLPNDTLDKMKQIVMDGYVNGTPTVSIMKRIQEQYGMSKRHARLIARDQLGKLSGQIAKMQQEDAGVDEYEWSDSGDGRVRSRHKALNGKRFKWSDPPEMGNGRHCHPGEDYQCRCVALPVFDIDDIDVPAKPKNPTKPKGKTGTEPKKRKTTPRTTQKKKPKTLTKPVDTSKKVDVTPKSKKLNVQDLYDDIPENIQNAKDMYEKWKASGKADKIKPFAQDYINSIGKGNFKVSVKKLSGARGQCSLIYEPRRDGLYVKMQSISLNSTEKNLMDYRVKTTFHEAFHLMGDGLKTDAHLLRAEHSKIEETITECVANYMAGQVTGRKFTPSYSDYLVEMLPRMKQLPEFDGCKTVSDFGRKMYKYRYGDASEVTEEWLEMSNKLKKTKAVSKQELFAENYDYISKNRDGIVEMVKEGLESWPSYVIEGATDEALKNYASSGKLTYRSDQCRNDEVVISNVLATVLSLKGV